MNYVGIDHHRQYSHMTMMDPEGQVLRTARVPNLRAEIEKFLEGGEALEAVIETGRSSYTMVGAEPVSGGEKSSRGSAQNVPASRDEDRRVDGACRQALRGDPGGSAHPDDSRVREISGGLGGGGDWGPRALRRRGSPSCLREGHPRLSKITRPPWEIP